VALFAESIEAGKAVLPLTLAAAREALDEPAAGKAALAAVRDLPAYRAST
jgi:hypothetical protein